MSGRFLVEGIGGGGGFWAILVKIRLNYSENWRGKTEILPRFPSYYYRVKIEATLMGMI